MIRNALFGWKTATLSFAGRLELLKSVVSSFHLFWSSCFLLPKQCIYLIEKHCRNFFWGCFENENKMKMVSWDNICKPFDRGGLGIVSIKSSAEGAIQRQVWSIASKQKNIWVDFIRSR